MRIFVIGNIMDVGEAAPSITTQVAFTHDGAIKGLLLMPRLWGMEFTAEEAIRTFRTTYDRDPFDLPVEDVAARISNSTSRYFAQTQRLRDVAAELEDGTYRVKRAISDLEETEERGKARSIIREIRRAAA